MDLNVIVRVDKKRPQYISDIFHIHDGSILKDSERGLKKQVYDSGLSQIELCERLNVSFCQLNRVLNGRVQSKSLTRSINLDIKKRTQQKAESKSLVLPNTDNNNNEPIINVKR